MGCFCCVINLEPFSGVLFLVGSCFKCINKLPFHFPLGNRTPCGFCLTVWTILIACSTGDQSQGRRGESVIRYNHSPCTGHESHWKATVNMIMTSDSHIYFKQAQVSLIFYLTERERERELHSLTSKLYNHCHHWTWNHWMTKSPWKWQMIHTCIHFKWAQVS